MTLSNMPVSDTDIKTSLMNILLEGNNLDLSSPDCSFENQQSIDGFSIGFLPPAVIEKLGFDPEQIEFFLMEAKQTTQPHVHTKGKSIILPVGDEVTGGTYLGKDLDKLGFVPGKNFLSINPGIIHFFNAMPDKVFRAIGAASPKISHENGFDIDSNFQISEFNSKYASVKKITNPIDLYLCGD